MPTTAEKISAIVEECARVNPEIKELKFGCLAVEKKAGRTWIKTNHGWQGVGEGQESNWSALEPGEILGRKIGIADVLLAIGQRPGYEGKCWIVDSDGLFILHELKRVAWNLSKDNIYDQEEATVDFIYQILCGV